MLSMTTPPCMLCGKSSVVELTKTEYDKLVNTNLAIQDALPDRDADFRELILTGFHGDCFDQVTRED